MKTAIGFTLIGDECRRAEIWIRRHRCTAKVDTATGGRITYAFTPTGSGTVIVVRCACGKSRDVTDYEAW